MKERLFVRLEMWVKEGEDGNAEVRYDYSLPKIDSDMIIKLYQLLIETLCDEISSLDGAEKLLNLKVDVEYEDKS